MGDEGVRDSRSRNVNGKLSLVNMVPDMGYKNES